jgi:hypothetical protein
MSKLRVFEVFTGTARGIVVPMLKDIFRNMLT